MIDCTHTVRLQSFGHAACGKAPMFRKCVNNNMLHVNWFARDWQPRSLLKPCVVSIIFGYCNTAACQAGWCRTCEAARAMPFWASRNRQARCCHAGVYAGPVLLQEPCW